MNQKDLIIELFKLSESGQPLKVDEMIPAVISIASFNEHGEYQADNYKERLKTFRLELGQLFKGLDKMIDEAKDIADKQVAYYRKHIERLKTLPVYGTMEDNDKILDFIRALDKDFYNFSEAEKLTGITRQTIKKKVVEGLDGVKAHYLNRAPLLTKESLIKIFRHYNATDPFNF